jgi:hypothetical protein
LTSTDSTAVVQTVACDLGRCGSCRGQVLSLTDAHLTPCSHVCHLPDAWREQVAAYPPCDDDQELDNLLDIEADNALERAWIGSWS